MADSSGRKLTWLWHLQRAELKTNYLPQKYIFMTNAWQLAILCQFNEADSHSFRDIQAGTKIAESILNPQLNLLVRAKVLLQDGTNYDLNLSQYLIVVVPTADEQISSQRL